MPQAGKDFRELRRELKRQHFIIEQSPGTNHHEVYKLTIVDGKAQRVWVTNLPDTSVSRRTLLNKISYCRRHGFKWKGH